MGIRFYCPNGHKLNVKSFQAGKRGFCPYCGVRIQVPEQSTRPPSKQGNKHGETVDQIDCPPPEEAEGAPPAVERPASAGPSHVSTFPAGPGLPPGSQAPQASPALYAPAVASQPATPVQPTADVVVPTESQLSAAAAAQPAEPRAPESTPGDPLDEAAGVVWYVRPPSGGQYGPASSDVMRTWIAEGRVSADSLVWREGWRDWQEAQAVFPELGAGSGGSELDAIAAAGPTASAGADYRRPYRRRQSNNSAIIITVLVMAVIVLFVVFLWVLLNPPAEPAAWGGGSHGRISHGGAVTDFDIRRPGSFVVQRPIVTLSQQPPLR